MAALLAFALPLAQAAEEGRRIIIGMLIVGVIFLGIVVFGETRHYFHDLRHRRR